MTVVTPPDVERWACRYLADQLADIPGLICDNAEPDDYRGDYPLVIVNDVPGALTGRVTYDWTIGITLRWGSRQDVHASKALAARILGIMTQDPEIMLAPGSPIAEIIDGGTSGPTLVTEDHDVARYYTTIDYTVAGEIH